MSLYKHDCDNCVYLGVHDDYRGTSDLYYCASSPTVIARYSDEPSDYVSGLVHMDKCPALAMAFVRAYLRGVIKITKNSLAL